mgnify:CR=1 FL=1
MNLFNQLRITLFAQLSALLFSTSSFSTIYFDHEADPIPIVEINVVIPVGALDEKEKNLGVTQVIPEYLDAGTKSLNRIAFHQKLSDYAAELSFGTGEHYSSWTLRFPYVEGKNYDSLIKILRENWNHPRYSQASFDLAIKKVNASFVSSLNSDQNLARTYLDYWIDKNIFGLSNLYIDDLNNISYAESRSFFEEKFLKVKDIWAGVVAPKQSFPLVKSILSTVFSKQGDIEMGMLKEELRERNFLVKKNGVKKFFIIEKSQRAQNVLALKSINNKKMSGSMELPYFVANNVLFGGRDSIFFNEIRNRRGLAYYIHSLERRINHYPVISFVSNPQANLIDSALKVVSDQLALIFKKQESLKKMNQEEWNLSLIHI